MFSCQHMCLHLDTLAWGHVASEQNTKERFSNVTVTQTRPSCSPHACSLWIHEQFLQFCGRTASWIECKIRRRTHGGMTQVWLTFRYSLLNYHCFLACDWSSSFQTVHTSRLSNKVKCDWQIHWGTPQAWFTFGNVLYICREKIPLIWLTIVGLTGADGPHQGWLNLSNTLLKPSFSVHPLWLNPPVEDVHPPMPCLSGNTMI